MDALKFRKACSQSSTVTKSPKYRTSLLFVLRGREGGREGGKEGGREEEVVYIHVHISTSYTLVILHMVVA